MDTSSIRNRQLRLLDILCLSFAISGESHKVNRATGEGSAIQRTGAVSAVKEPAAPACAFGSSGLVTSLVAPSHFAHCSDLGRKPLMRSVFTGWHFLSS